MTVRGIMNQPREEIMISRKPPYHPNVLLLSERDQRELLRSDPDRYVDGLPDIVQDALVRTIRSRLK